MRRSYTGEFKTHEINDLEIILAIGKLLEPQALVHLLELWTQYPVLVRYGLGGGRNENFECSGRPFLYFQDTKQYFDKVD